MGKLIDVAAARWPAFVRLIERAAKIASKSGYPPVTFEVVGTRTKTLPESGAMYEVHEVRLTGGDAIHSEWEIEGSLDHVGTEAALITGTVPPIFREKGCICEHCGTKRQRRTTYLVKNTTTYKRMLIGRSCLGEFLSIESPNKLIAHFEGLAQLLEELDSLGTLDGHGGGETYAFEEMAFPAADVLALGHERITTHGWWPAALAKDAGQEATSWAVQSMCCKALAAGTPLSPSGHHFEVAGQVIEWLRSSAVEDDALESNYLHNLRTIALSGYVRFAHFGLWLSALKAHQRMLDDAKPRDPAEDLPSEPVGTLNERIGRVVTILGKKRLDSDWGVTTLYRMRDPSGNILVWFCSGSTFLQEGQSYHIEGRVSRHEIYKDKWQTTLTRVTAQESKLFEAIGARDPKKVKKILKLGPNLETEDATGYTALKYAAALHSVELVELLLEAGAAVNATSSAGTTAMSIACAQGNVELASKLLEFGAVCSEADIALMPESAAELRALAFRLAA